MRWGGVGAGVRVRGREPCPSLAVTAVLPRSRDSRGLFHGGDSPGLHSGGGLFPSSPIRPE